LHKTSSILKDHFEKIFAVEVQDFEAAHKAEEEKPKKKAKKSKK